MTRRELREQIFKLLFRVEFTPMEEMPQQEELFLEETDQPFEKDDRPFPEKDAAYITGKYEKIVEKLPEIDAALNENTQKWTTDRMGKVELTILRLAVYEIRYDEDIPASVAINEAVELAKKYAQDDAYSFINAILAKFA